MFENLLEKSKKNLTVSTIVHTPIMLPPETGTEQKYLKHSSFN